MPELEQGTAIVDVAQVVGAVIVAAAEARADVSCFEQRIELATEEHVVEVAEVGAPGRDGETAGSTFTADAGETIHGGRVVFVANGQVFHPSTSDASHAPRVIGIATQSANPGSPVVVRIRGAIVDESQSWAPGYVYCGDGGVLTQSPAPHGWLLAVARSRDANVLEVGVEIPFVRV